MHFNSLAPCGANQLSVDRSLISREFQLTRPVWGEPLWRNFCSCNVCYFNSLAPCGANHSHYFTNVCALSFQLTRPVWGEPVCCVRTNHTYQISTHSPRVGRTLIRIRLRYLLRYFNSLAPCGANHALAARNKNTIYISTHSPRVGRTIFVSYSNYITIHFNSLAPCGANLETAVRWKISESFQLTRPVWGEPYFFVPMRLVWHISTHSPRVGRTT